MLLLNESYLCDRLLACSVSDVAFVEIIIPVRANFYVIAAVCSDLLINSR